MRRGGFVTVLVLFCVLASSVRGQSVQDADRLANQKRFSEAEAAYRRVLTADAQSRDALLGLGRLLLWQLRYPEAEDVFRRALQVDERDAAAREGLATALYWSGDYRGARREFTRVLELDPRNEVAGRSLAEIGSASRPAWRAFGGTISDDQPYRLSRAEAEGSLFSDPLTRWDLAAGSYFYDDPEGDRSGTSPFARVAAEIVVARPRMTFSPAATFLRFPDGETKVLPAFTISVPLPANRARLDLAARETELLRVASSTATHASVTEVGATWSFDSSEWLAAISAHALRYFDDNEGADANAWLLAPVAKSRGASYWVGISGAWRDTNESRFTLRSVASAPVDGGFQYAYDAVYDPYYTPQEQLEARLIAAARWTSNSGITVRVQIDGGRGEDKVLSFGPPSGTSPAPPVSTPELISRTFNPWRAAVDISWPLGGDVRLDLRYEHAVTVYYESDDVSAAVVGRF